MALAEVKVISSDPKADGMKLRAAWQHPGPPGPFQAVPVYCHDQVSSNSKELKAEDTAKQRQEIEAETKAGPRGAST